MDVSLETVLYIFVSGSGVMLLWLAGVRPGVRKWQDTRRERTRVQANIRDVELPKPDLSIVRDLISTEIESQLSSDQEEITLAGQSETPAADLAALGRSRRRSQDD